MIPTTIWWTTWKEGDRCIFQGKDMSFKDFNSTF